MKFLYDKYIIDGVSKVLRRLGFVYKQIIATPGKLNEEKQGQFIKEYEELKATKTEDAVILPSYSPNLNFIERLWKYMKKYIIGVKYREKFKEFERDIHYFFDNLEQYEDELRQFIGTEFHRIHNTV